MEQLHVANIISVILSILFAVALVKAVALKKESSLLSQQLTETSNSLERTRQELAALRGKQQKIEEFQNTLVDAELSTRIQKFRTTGQKSDRFRTTPEKYCYVHSLAEKGLSSDEIAAVLTISTHEAKQLVTLAKIAQAN